MDKETTVNTFKEFFNQKNYESLVQSNITIDSVMIHCDNTKKI